MQAPFSPHIRDIRNTYRSSECRFTQKWSQTERLNRQGCVWVFGHANNCWTKTERIGVNDLDSRGGWPHRPEEPFWWLTALLSPLCILITVLKINVSTPSLQGTWHHKSLLSLKKGRKPCQDKNYLPITISNYDACSPFVLLYAILSTFFVKQRFSEIGWYRLFKANWGKEREDRGGGGGLNCPQPAVTTLNWWDAKERKQKGICLRFAGSSRSSACYVASTVMQHRHNKTRWRSNASLIVLLKGAIWTHIKSFVWDRFFLRGDDIGVHCIANYIRDVQMEKWHGFSANIELCLHISSLQWKWRTSRCTTVYNKWTNSTFFFQWIFQGVNSSHFKRNP